MPAYKKAVWWKFQAEKVKKYKDLFQDLIKSLKYTSGFKHLPSLVIPQGRCCSPCCLWPDAKPEDGRAVFITHRGLWVRVLWTSEHMLKKAAENNLWGEHSCHQWEDGLADLIAFSQSVILTARFVIFILVFMFLQYFLHFSVFPWQTSRSSISLGEEDGWHVVAVGIWVLMLCVGNAGHIILKLVFYRNR